MHKKPLTLTIVIPVYNEELYLPACLEAIAAQTKAPQQVLVVDNNSSDMSAKIAKSYRFVTLIKQSQMGVIFARDAGFDSVKTDIIARIDADTIVSRTWVESLHTVFADGKVDAATGAVGLYDAPFARFNHWVDHIMRKYIYLFGTPHNKPFLSGPNMALRRDIWQKIKTQVCRDERTHEDIDLAIHIAKAGGTIVYSPNLKASISTRRYNDSFTDFRRYMQMFDYTYRRHKLHGIRVRSASVMYWLGYLSLRPLRRLFGWLDKLSGSKKPLDLHPRKYPNNI